MHKCAYADAIGKTPYFIENGDGVDVCGFCHAPKTEPEPKTPAKTVRK